MVHALHGGETLIISQFSDSCKVSTVTMKTRPIVDRRLMLCKASSCREGLTRKTDAVDEPSERDPPKRVSPSSLEKQLYGSVDGGWGGGSNLMHSLCSMPMSDDDSSA
jgi:hypothetical protein